MFIYEFSSHIYTEKSVVRLTKYLVKYERVRNPIGVVRILYKLRFLVNVNSCKFWLIGNLLKLKVARFS